MPESLTTDELNQDQVSVTTQCSSPDMELSECANVHLVQDAGSNANPRIFCQSFVFVLYSSSSWHKREEDDCWACLTFLSIILWPNQLQYFVFYIWEAQAFDASFCNSHAWRTLEKIGNLHTTWKINVTRALCCIYYNCTCIALPWHNDTFYCLLKIIAASVMTTSNDTWPNYSAQENLLYSVIISFAVCGECGHLGGVGGC